MSSPGRFTLAIERMGEVLWAAVLTCLPITTFPLFSSVSGAQVAPLSLLPCILLLLIWTIPFLLRKGSLPKETIPLAIFALAAVVSCAAAFYIDIPGFKGKTISGQEIRSLFTLAVGLTFFLTTTTWIQETDKLKKTWKYITIGGLLSLVWTGCQAFFVLRSADNYPAWLELIQSWFVVLSPSFSPKLGRVSGFTYEASWFAHQMVMIYLPIWIASSYFRTSAFKFRVVRLSLENILLVFGLAAFFLSSPRIGLISFFLMAIYLFLRLNLVVHRKIVLYIHKRDSSFINKSSINRFAINLIVSLLIIAIYVLLLAAVLNFAAQRDWRLSILVSQPPTMKEVVGLLTLDQATLLDLSHRFIFLERMIYWLNGWNVFNLYPWLGVGLGNAGFFFPQLAPALGWATTEIRNVLFYLPQLPNVKSFWFRLLAETGLVGFSVFLTWFYILFKSSRITQHHPDPAINTFALAGTLALLAFIGEGFSIDSFAMPYLWLAAGMIAAIGMIYRRDLSTRFPSN